MTVFERIESLRKERKISQGNLEKQLGFSNGSISKWKTSMPKPERLQKIAEYFGVSIEYLMTGKDNKDTDAGIHTDDHDIKKHIDMIMESLDEQDEIVYEGQRVDLNEQSRRMLRYAMEIAYEAAKNNKK